MNAQPNTDTQERVRLEAMYELFRLVAMDDQKGYYEASLKKNRKAALGASTYAAFFALLAGLASALAGLLVSGEVTRADIARCTFNSDVIEISVASLGDGDVVISEGDVAEIQNGDCGFLGWLVPILVVAVVSPVIGGAFTTLNDLYQWDRLVSVYNNALESLEVADAQSPVEEIKETAEYRAALEAYIEGTLDVMRDEQTQWGQLIKTPTELAAYYERALNLYESNIKKPGEKPTDSTDNNEEV